MTLQTDVLGRFKLWITTKLSEQYAEHQSAACESEAAQPTQEKAPMKRYAVIPSRFTGRQQLVITPSHVRDVQKGDCILITMIGKQTIELHPEPKEKYSAWDELLGILFTKDELKGIAEIEKICGRYINPNFVRSLDFIGGLIMVGLSDGETLQITSGNYADYQRMVAAVYGEEAAREMVMWMATPPPDPLSKEDRAEINRRHELARRVPGWVA